MTTFCSRESSPTVNWSPSSPRHCPILYESGHDEPHGTVSIHESDYAFNSQDNDIENIHENFNDERLPVFFNEHGQWNGPAEFSTWIREITRSLIGLGYKNWKEVPQDYKEDIWNSVQVSPEYVPGNPYP